jgi:hypothetical protein
LNYGGLTNHRMMAIHGSPLEGTTTTVDGFTLYWEGAWLAQRRDVLLARITASRTTGESFTCAAGVAPIVGGDAAKQAGSVDCYLYNLIQAEVLRRIEEHDWEPRGRYPVAHELQGQWDWEDVSPQPAP